MTEYWLDYSAAKLAGTTIRNAGYTGVVRYIDSPANLSRKHTDLNEYRSHVAAGLKVYLVMQTTTTASDGGYPVGQDHARRALAGANYLGYSGPIFFTNDRTTVPNPAAWRAYLDGAASILGIGRTGAYGFANAMDLAVGHASFFWQAGRRSDVRAHAHLWQDNNTQVTVGGITCDRNLVLKSMGDSDMLADERNALLSIYNALFKNNRGELEHGTQGDQSIITRLVELQVNARTLVDRPTATVDAAALAQQLAALLPDLTRSLSDADLVRVAKAVNDEADRRDRDGDASTGQAS